MPSSVHCVLLALPGRSSRVAPWLLIAGALLTAPVRSDQLPASGHAARVLAAVNDYRARNGLPPLVPAPALERIATAHSQGMAAQRRPSHGGFGARFERAGSDLCVENVAAGFVVPEQTVHGWRQSPAHDRNLLEPRVRWVGVASVELYTTLFACDSDGVRSTTR